MSNDTEFDKSLGKQEEDLARSHRAARRRNMAIWALAVLSLIFGAVCLFLAMDNARLAVANASFGAQQQDEKQEIAAEASRALCGQGDREIYDRELCAKWAEAAQESSTPTVPPLAAPVVVAPSQEDLVAAFREYCADGNCQGRDGAPPTADDIAAAFVTFCADGRCTGPAGEDGAPGTAGKDAVALAPQYEMVLAAVTEVCSTGLCSGPAGDPGPGPTPDMVLAAVQTVCANDACRGPAGADSTVPGPEGKQGPEGRGIRSAFCGDDGRWLITYTDGLTSDGGQCRTTITPPIGGTP